MAKQTTKRAERKRGDVPLWDSAKEHRAGAAGPGRGRALIKAYGCRRDHGRLMNDILQCSHGTKYRLLALRHVKALKFKISTVMYSNEESHAN